MRKTRRNDDKIMVIIGMMSDFIPFYLFNMLKHELVSEMDNRNHKRRNIKRAKRDAATSRKAKRKA